MADKSVTCRAYETLHLAWWSVAGMNRPDEVPSMLLLFVLKHIVAPVVVQRIITKLENGK